MGLSEKDIERLKGKNTYPREDGSGKGEGQPGRDRKGGRRNKNTEPCEDSPGKGQGGGKGKGKNR